MPSSAPPGSVGRLVVVGEALLDLLPAEQAPPGAGAALALRALPGGSPANVAVALARLGVPVTFAGRFSTGALGRWRRQCLGVEGVDLAASVDADRPATLAAVTVDAGGVASYQFYGPETADWWWRAEELPAPAALAGGAVHTGSLATAMTPGAAVLAGWAEEVRGREDVVISYDPNVRPSIVGGVDECREAVAPWLGVAHVVKVSEEDIATLYPGRSPAAVAEWWLAAARGPELVVVTAGAAGAGAWHRDGRCLSRPAPPVRVVDTVGAGDAFTAGLLAALREGGWLSPAGLAAIDDGALGAALDLGAAVASVTCSRPGADPPSRARLAPSRTRGS